MDKSCTWCGAADCNPADAFHDLLRRHDLHAQGWSSIGPGWVPMVERLINDLRALGWDGELGQIKEKFGELRFIPCVWDDAMRVRILAARRASHTTCWRCGSEGNIRDVVNWYVACCEACAAVIARDREAGGTGEAC